MTDPTPGARQAPKLHRLAPELTIALATALFAAACDNPACVFGPNGCTGTAGGSSSDAAATVPANHQWIELAAPTIAARIPASSATTLGTDSPMALVFSESMASSSLTNALRLEETGSGGFGAPIQITSALVAEGRVLIVLPLQPLTLATSYDLIWNDNAVPLDLQGQGLAIPTTRLAGNFTVANTAPAIVRLLGSFPADLSTQQSGVGEFIAVFDRKLNPLSVTATSFDVKVGGVQPAFDPLAQPLAVVLGGVSTNDTRIYRWHSLDAALEPAPLGPGLQVDVSLSPVGSKITAVDTSVLPAIHVRYDIAAISPALSAEIVSMPTDAIGIANITGGTPTLDIAVTLASAVVGDRLGVFIFGTSVGLNPRRVSVFREVTLSTTATTVSLGEADLDLATDQDLGRLADGTLNFAVRMQRGNVLTAVRMLDADTKVSGVQSVVLDLLRPTLTGLGFSGSNQTSFRSDLRHFSLVGRANEKIRAAEVSTTGLGNNGVLTPVIGSTPTGLFVAAPVLLGTLTPAQMPLPFTAVIYDNAFNAALLSIAGDFTQLGASGPGAALPGPSISVEVFDSASLAPLAAARVMTHEDIGGTITPIAFALTTAAGTATLSAASAGETLVTVDLVGFDLFTFEDVPTDRLSIPLTRSSALPASVAGIVSSKAANFSSFTRSVVDSRRFGSFEPQIPVQSCNTNPATQASDCPYGPGAIRPNQLGVTSLLAVEIPASELNYNVASFLRAFQIAIPVAPAGVATLSNVNLATNSLLSDPGVDPEERAIDGPALSLDAGSTGGIVLASLDGGPIVLVEAQVRGVPGTAAVGLGAAFTSGANTWNVRSAYPGAVDGIQDTPQDALGALVASGALNPDLRLSAELRDSFGARVGRRSAFSQLGATLRPTSAPLIVSPLPGANTGGPSFNLVFTNAIKDSDGTPGIYAATLTSGAAGRRWTLWRSDLSNASGASRTIHVPDLAALGGSALPNGALTAVVEAFGYASFTTSAFHWSDIAREYDSFSAGVPSAFTQP